jgi:hypothetical protein
MIYAVFRYNDKIITLVSVCLLKPRKEFIKAVDRWHMGLIYTRLQTLVTGFGLCESMKNNIGSKESANQGECVRLG